MRKNSLKNSKKHSNLPARNGRRSSSNGPTSPNSVCETPLRKSAAARKHEKNSDRRAEEDALIQKALDLVSKEDFVGAVGVLESLVAKYPDSKPGQGLLGSYYCFFLDEPQKAIPHLQIATRLSPKSEKASLALFHSLWKTDQIDEALEEIKRFQLLTNWSCQDYLDIVAEINEKWADEKPRKAKKPKSKTSS